MDDCVVNDFGTCIFCGAKWDTEDKMSVVESRIEE